MERIQDPICDVCWACIRLILMYQCLLTVMHTSFNFPQARQFTNVHQFALRCLVCGQGLVGQEDALQHAAATGHINFGETARDK